MSNVKVEVTCLTSRCRPLLLLGGSGTYNEVAAQVEVCLAGIQFICRECKYSTALCSMRGIKELSGVRCPLYNDICLLTIEFCIIYLKLFDFNCQIYFGHCLSFFNRSLVHMNN